jgi:hypothetical protein
MRTGHAAGREKGDLGEGTVKNPKHLHGAYHEAEP